MHKQNKYFLYYFYYFRLILTVKDNKNNYYIFWTNYKLNTMCYKINIKVK